MHVAERLREGPHDPEALSLAADYIASGNGAALFDALSNEIQRHSEDKDSPVPAMMLLLQQIMDSNSMVAGYLMARLYPLAGRHYYSHIYDAIELWMYHSTSIELADALQRLAVEGIRPALRKRYGAWSETIRQNAIQDTPRSDRHGKTY